MVVFELSKMFPDELENRKEEKKLLSSLSLEVDGLFLKLRKDYQVICREIQLLKSARSAEIKKSRITPLDEDVFRKIIKELPIQLVDEYIMYMLTNETNSILRNVEKYNELLDKRKKEVDNNSCIDLISVNEKLADCLQHLGAMVYHLHTHLHIHLNMLTLWLRNLSIEVESQQELKRENHEF